MKPINNHVSISQVLWKKVATLIFLLGLLLEHINTLAATDCNAVTEISTIECESLLEFYHSTNGAKWRHNHNWNVTNTPCSWLGVVCRNGGVTEIRLFANQLRRYQVYGVLVIAGTDPDDQGNWIHFDNEVFEVY